MKISRLILGFLLIASLFLVGCQNNQVPQTRVLKVFAASSLTDALEELKVVYEAHNNIKLEFNYAASGTLQKQIEEGAPVDVFISAGVKQMDTLEGKGLIRKESRIDLLKNTLVLIGDEGLKGKLNSLEDLAGEEIKYIALGTPETVPVGMYTKEALQYYDLWESLKEKYVYTKDVRQVLSYVKSGNTEVGFVYLSDAMVSENTEVILEIPKEAHSPIIYPAAIINNNNPEESLRFLEFLTSDEGGRVFEKYGYVLVR